ncbi:hypothetical protein ebA459 [Aromatoleum aromaticum EbN1]|uniref:Uncharacterized protein n=1 Tax=Aromatoleum aromaticum (strain DSM 19018 / LMG 30748 / EbN1) TaxID=76114 RepID=Q5P8K2_AROAE|nr:hypothetical protein ebA459 [Aromatoleum aromaticum EbN1]
MVCTGFLAPSRTSSWNPACSTSRAPLSTSSQRRAAPADAPGPPPGSAPCPLGAAPEPAPSALPEAAPAGAVAEAKSGPRNPRTGRASSSRNAFSASLLPPSTLPASRAMAFNSRMAVVTAFGARAWRRRTFCTHAASAASATSRSREMMAEPRDAAASLAEILPAGEDRCALESSLRMPFDTSRSVMKVSCQGTPRARPGAFAMTYPKNRP